MNGSIVVEDIFLVGSDHALKREWYKTRGDPFCYYVRQCEANGVWVWYASDLNGEPNLKIDMASFRFRVVLE